MRNDSKNIIGVVFTLLIVALLSSCTTEGPCEGSLIVVNTIPDITMAVGDTVYIDLTNPRIFERPPDDAIAYGLDPIYGFGFVKISLIVNTNDNNRLSLIEIISLNPGESKRRIVAGAGCLENETTLKITVQ